MTTLIEVTPKADVKKYTNSEIEFIHIEAKTAAKEAANNVMQGNIELFGTADRGGCGFGWVVIKDLRKNTKVFKALEKFGWSVDWNNDKYLWSPANAPVQSIDVHAAGADAYADVLCKYNFKAVGLSRLD